jgi:hypothetical protein
MRSAGKALLALGALLGAAVGLGLVFDIALPGMSWLVTVGLVKLSLIASGGLMAVGAGLQRLARRSEERERLSAGSPSR